MDELDKTNKAWWDGFYTGLGAVGLIAFALVLLIVSIT